jgi:hypothetical protein
VTVADEGVVESEKSGEGVTVKATPLLATEPTVTTTLPEGALKGTENVMLVSLQLNGEMGVAPRVIELNPFVGPKFDPLIVTVVAAGPDEGFKLVITGATLKFGELLAKPPTLTTTLAGPAITPVGMGTTMLVAVQLLGVPLMPANETVLVPCVAPKLVPVMVTDVPTGPDVGERLVMLGETVKGTPPLGTPPTVTTRLPVVAPLGTGTTMFVLLQLVGVAAIPLKVIVLVP